MSSQDEIRALVHVFVKGWNTNDPAMLASVFTEDADFTAITGLHARGREVIARGHEEILSTIYRNTTLAAEVDEINFLRPDVAFANVRFSLRKDGQSFFPGVAHTSAGLVVTYNERTWSIAVFRNMVPFVRPAAGPVEHEIRQAMTA
jgi:uncharacterized protein (TIGR02246 family)